VRLRSDAHDRVLIDRVFVTIDRIGHGMTPRELKCAGFLASRERCIRTFSSGVPRIMNHPTPGRTKFLSRAVNYFVSEMTPKVPIESCGSALGT
jgi:hypothetical protein